MKLNNKGFAISTVMYIILIMAVILIALTLTILSSRKLVLDKIKSEVISEIYQSGLPNEYQEVEYIESNGTQYIDTKYIPKNTTSVKSKLKHTNSNGGTLFGAQDGTDNNVFAVAGGNYEVYARYFISQGNLMATSPSIFELEINPTETIYTSLNGSSNTIQHTPLGTTTSYSLYLFARNSSGNVLENSYKSMRIYYFQIYENERLVRDFIPCYRKSDGVIGLYDLVNGVFYVNSGTGTFVKGDNIIPLPNEYQQVEYIESSGTQYIDTDFKASSNTEIVYDFEYLSGRSNAYIPLLGQRMVYGENMFSVWVHSSTGRVAANYGAFDSSNSTNINDRSGFGRHVYENMGNKFYVDGILVIEAPSSSFQTSAPLIIFGLNTGSGAEVRELSGRVYSLKIYENDEIQRNFVPCYRKSDGVIGMYDLVNDVFYTNSGTGTFTKDDDVIHLPDEYQEVEYIESSGTQEISNFYTVPSSYTTIEFETKTNTSSSVEQGIIGIDKVLELAYTTTKNRIALYDPTTGSLAYVSTKNVLNNDVVLKALLSNGTTKTLYTDLDSGQTVTSSAGYTSINNGSVDLFVYNGANNYYFNGKLYYAKVRVDNQLVRHMIPCYRKSDGVIGMYDLVNDVFYTNTGTGTFTKGSNVIH